MLSPCYVATVQISRYVINERNHFAHYLQISASILHLDRAVKYNVHPRTAIALKALRQHLSDVMATLMKGKSLDETGSKWFALAMRCLAMLPEVEAASIGVT